ncbi:fluoride efflux transporter FluC [Georgenia subflava]|uniref:Fluoride-specific ion channel FluC n=1 Tax=Georgenia subflava TaxID=1622177 RepID=A0A6N7EK75_9MICO|nr:CrcB family protein [Georgenia subflava]MPV36596.1 hypothetical protein [Georgenia subflava]
MTVLLLALAGGLGAVSRYLVDGAVRARTRPDNPAGVLLVNITGSFLLGLVTGLLGQSAGPLALVVGTGFCGGYTTFSTSVVVVVDLLRHRRVAAALRLAAGTLVSTVAAAALGLAIGTTAAP